MNTLLEQLKNKRLVWQANQQDIIATTDSTGYKELDHALHGGFPQQGVIDIDSPLGIGEIRLLLPALRARQQQTNRQLVFIAAPMQINGEMFAEAGLSLEHILIVQPETPEHALWSAEQCLKSGCCHSVLLWHQQLEIAQAKRLQLAAEQGDALHILFRHKSQLAISLPVNLAMQLSPHDQGLSVRITKRKGGWPDNPFHLDMTTAWPALTRINHVDNVIRLPQSKVS
jgi:cell division inhibitor SulA